MILFAERYHVLLDRKNTRKQQKKLKKTTKSFPHLGEIIDEARKNISFETPDLTPQSKKSDDEECGQNGFQIESRTKSLKIKNYYKI